MTTSKNQEQQLQEINLKDEPKRKSTSKSSQVKQLQELTKQVLSSKSNDIQIKQSLDYIKQKISYTSTSKAGDQSYDGDKSFREGMKKSFLDESESNYSSISTVASISTDQLPSDIESSKPKCQSTVVVTRDESSSQSENDSSSSFIELWNLFKQIYMQEKTLQNKFTQNQIAQMSKVQNQIEKEKEQEEEGYGDNSNQFNIFSCLQCFIKKQLPKNLLIEKNIILYMYNTKKLQKENNSNLLQKINRFYQQVNTKASKIMQDQQAIDNLNVLSNLFLIAFSDFHSEIFFHLLYVYEAAPIINNQQKIPLTKIASAFTSDIIFLLSTSKIDSQVMQRQSVINYVNNLFFALMFCYFQECVRNNNDFSEASSKIILTALLKQTNSKPDSIINYFTKRFPSFLIDRNFHKYI